MEPRTEQKEVAAYIKPLAALSGIVILASLLYMYAPVPMQTQEPLPTLSDQIRAGEAPIPEYTPAVEQKLQASAGFAALVSYTDQGFEPGALALERGETVRFVNNSSGSLWILENTQLSADEAASCATGAVDSCGLIPSQDFWEFTFDTAGEWTLVNNADKQKTILVHVE